MENPFDVPSEVFVRILIDAIMERGVEQAHLERVIKDAELRSRVVDLLLGPAPSKPHASQTPPPLEEQEADVEVYDDARVFPAHVSYRMPTFRDLRQQFSERVDATYADFFLDSHERRRVARTDRVCVFVYVRMSESTTEGLVLQEIRRRGLRSATFEELLAFDRQYPNEGRQISIVALGDSPPQGQEMSAHLGFIPIITQYVGGKNLMLKSSRRMYGTGYRFLAVREDASSVT
jgi:hypothetical protein